MKETIASGRWLWWFIVLCISSHVHAQKSAAADSLQVVADLEESNAYYFEQDYLSAIELADGGLIKARRYGWQRLEQKALIILTYSHSAINDVAEAGMCMKAALAISKKLKDTISQIDLLSFKAAQLQQSWHYDSSFIYYQQALSLAAESEDKYGQGSVYNNMAVILAEQNRFESANDYFHKAVDISQSNADTSGIFTGFINIARCFIFQETLDSAAHYMRLGHMLLSATQQPVDRGAYYHYFGLLQLAKKDYTSAKAALHAALPYFSEANDRYNTAHVYKLLGDTHLGMRHADSCLYYLKRAETLSISIGANEVLRDVYPQLAKCLAQMENWEQAYSAANKALELRERFWNESIHQHVAEVEASRQVDKFTSENEYLRRITEKYDEQKRWQRLITWFSIAFVGLFAVFSYFLWQSKRKESRLNEELESIVQSRTVALQEANKKLQQFLDDQKTFTHITSHDLKEPLRNISGFTTLLERRMGGALNDEMKEYMTHIRNSAKHMNLLIEGIQFYSSIADTTQPAAREPVNVTALLNRIVGSLTMRMQRTGAVIEYPDDLPTIESYPEALQVILKNLIENGIKYNKHAKPKVTIRHKEFPDTHHILIQDNGIGIAPDYQVQIFEMFKRLHTRQEFEGTGMGLAICKKLAERLGGSILLESSEGKGSTFTLVLPNHRAKP